MKNLFITLALLISASHVNAGCTEDLRTRLGFNVTKYPFTIKEHKLDSIPIGTVVKDQYVSIDDHLSETIKIGNNFSIGTFSIHSGTYVVWIYDHYFGYFDLSGKLIYKVDVGAASIRNIELLDDNTALVVTEELYGPRGTYLDRSYKGKAIKVYVVSSNGYDQRTFKFQSEDANIILIKEPTGGYLFKNSKNNQAFSLNFK